MLNCYVSLKLFGWWWYKEDKDCTIHIYFDDKVHLTDAKKWLKDKYSDSVQVWKVQERNERKKKKFI